jgi:hypothetical protein
MRFFTVLSNPKRPAFHLIWLGWFIGGILDIIDGIVTVLSGAILSSSLGSTFRFYMVAIQCRDFDRKNVATLKADGTAQSVIEE